MAFDGKSEAMGNFVLNLFDFLAVELDDPVTILANDVIVVRMFGIIGIVELMVLAEIHLAQQPALRQ